MAFTASSEPPQPDSHRSSTGDVEVETDVEDETTVEPETDREAANRRLDCDFTEEEMEVLDLWSSATSYTALLALNRDFLTGGFDFSSYHMGPVHEETKPMLPTLLRLHDFGMLTLSSQPSKQIAPYDGTCQNCADCGTAPRWLEKTQRAFITFLFPRYDDGKHSSKAVAKFLVELMADESFDANITTSGSRCRIGHCIPNTKTASNFPTDWYTHLVKEAATEDALKYATTFETKSIEIGCPCILGGFNPMIIEIAQPFVIHVLARSLKEKDLPGKVESAARRAGLKRLYNFDAMHGAIAAGGFTLEGNDGSKILELASSRRVVGSAVDA